MSTGSRGPQGPAWSCGEAADGWQMVSPLLMLPLAGPVTARARGPAPPSLSFHLGRRYLVGGGKASVGQARSSL